MSNSLRDQLLKSGIVKQFREEKQAQPAKGERRPGGGRPPAKRPPRPAGGEIDLAKAYAMRAQSDAAERRRAEQEAAEQARLKRERKARLQKLLEGQALNKAEAELARHFEYGGKIRRVHVDAEQLAAINAGQLGVVQQNGRYLLVSLAVAEQVREIDPHHLALLVDPAAKGEEDDVPDDLMW
ncbi:DUF2058 domain-containing protein [Frateuria defendens]|uniref:DUF2058 domain-containing protein n=1 Tax=Frateuria defendens TaxID=2219559 RepID=UPI00066FEBF4|nr:DUF2058 family protein [Frateuria defendens]